VLHSRRSEGVDPWQADDGWRLSGRAPWRVELAAGGERHRVMLVCRIDDWQVYLDNEPAFEVRADLNAGELRIEYDGQRQRIDTVMDGDQISLFSDGLHWTFERIDPLHRRREDDVHSGTLTAPMPGRIVALLVEPGACVTQGTPLLVMEAMKMEHTLTAPHDGSVRAFLAAEGELVADGAVLVDFGVEESIAV